jgi:hypothetical protein
VGLTHQTPDREGDGLAASWVKLVGSGDAIGVALVLAWASSDG